MKHPGLMRGVISALVLVLLLSSGATEAWSWTSNKDTTQTTVPASQAAKDATKQAFQDAGDAAKETGESIKQTANAAYEGVANAAKTVTGGRKDDKSTGPTGAAYRDKAGNYVADTSTTVRDKVSDAAGAVKDATVRTSENIQGTARVAADKTKETLNSAGSGAYNAAAKAGETISQAAASTKDAAYNGAQSAREGAGRAYDATADTVGSAKDKVWGEQPKAKSSGGVYDSAGNYYKSAKEMAARTGETVQDHASYAGQKASDTAQAAKDAAQRAGQATKDGAANAYNSASETLGYKKPEEQGYGSKAYGAAKDRAANAYNAASETLGYKKPEEKGYGSRAYDATKDRAANAYNAASETLGYKKPEEKGYGSKAYDAAHDSVGEVYEGARNKLGSIIEVLGWHRVPEEEYHNTLKNFSPYDIMVGNTKYVWHQKPKSESYYENAKDTVGEVSQTVGQKLEDAGEYVADTASQVKDSVYDVAGRAKDNTVDVAERAKNVLWDAESRTTSSVSDYSQKGMEVIGAGAAAIGLNKLGDMERKPGVFREFIRFLYQSLFSITLGSVVWMTFVSGALLSKSIPREQFRSVQSKMFPFFLKFVAGGELGLVLLYSIMSIRSKWQVLNLVALLASTCFNAFVLEPETTKIYFERLKLEKEEGRGLNEGDDNVSEKLAEKRRKFNEVHGFSTVLNLLNLLGLTGHAWHLAHRLWL